MMRRGLLRMRAGSRSMQWQKGLEQARSPRSPRRCQSLITGRAQCRRPRRSAGRMSLKTTLRTCSFEKRLRHSLRARLVSRTTCRGPPSPRSTQTLPCHVWCTRVTREARDLACQTKIMNPFCFNQTRFTE